MTGFRKNGSNDFFDPKLWKSSNSCYVMDLLSDPFKIKKKQFFVVVHGPWFAKCWARLVILIHFLEQKSILEFLTESDNIFDHSSFPKFRHLYFLGWLGTNIESLGQMRSGEVKSSPLPWTTLIMSPQNQRMSKLTRHIFPNLSQICPKVPSILWVIVYES